MNINRDYLIEIICRFDVPFCGNKFELVPTEKTMTFYKDDRNSGTIYLLLHGWKKELSLKLAILCPSKKVEEYTPRLIGIEDDTFIFKVSLTDDTLATVGKHEFQLFAQSRDGKTLSSDIGKFKVKSCL